MLTHKYIIRLQTFLAFVCVLLVFLLFFLLGSSLLSAERLNVRPSLMLSTQLMSIRFSFIYSWTSSVYRKMQCSWLFGFSHFSISLNIASLCITVWLNYSFNFLFFVLYIQFQLSSYFHIHNNCSIFQIEIRSI